MARSILFLLTMFSTLLFIACSSHRQSVMISEDFDPSIYDCYPEDDNFTLLKERKKILLSVPDAKISRPEFVKIHDEKIYIFDYDSRLIFVFSQDGELLDTLGKDSFRDINFMDLEVSDNGKIVLVGIEYIYIHDGEMRRIPNKFRIAGVVIGEKSLFGRTYYYNIKNKLMRTNEGDLICEIDFNGNLIRSYGKNPFNYNDIGSQRFDHTLEADDSHLYYYNPMIPVVSIFPLEGNTQLDVEIKSDCLAARARYNIASIQEFVRNNGRGGSRFKRIFLDAASYKKICYAAAASNHKDESAVIVNKYVAGKCIDTFVSNLGENEIFHIMDLNINNNTMTCVMVCKNNDKFYAIIFTSIA